ncbi:alcohol dehydrogenase catalytic domain-containing protein [Sanguibacter sp. HDW7]|uniref:alcohol dehydrogenase catalytic domain-containing protein n=1 Tax=Sanguibacter sp. HDW7 TaxID=2714931 RepID=UPI00140CCCA3|nr:alcohol dehydrogenase catalytic domain-containing protein [Sanguibacter sp. HDW7]
MRAVTWQGAGHVAVETVPDPTIVEPTDAVVRITSTAICGSDLHLHGPLTRFCMRGDLLGHEAMGVVEEAGRDVAHVGPGDRVVVPSKIPRGRCWMCQRGLRSQCETTQVRSEGRGAALLWYALLHGAVPGGQAELLRVPRADYGLVPVPDGGSPDDRYLSLSGNLPTAWPAVRRCGDVGGATVVVLGLGPVGQFAARVALHLGTTRVVDTDPVPERLAVFRDKDDGCIKVILDPAAVAA